MIVKIENPKFSYVGNNIVLVPGEAVIYADDGTTELFRRKIVTKGNLVDDTTDAKGEFLWKTNAENSLAQQTQSIVDKYKAMMQIVKSAWPDAATPEDALSFLASEVEAKIVK